MVKPYKIIPLLSNFFKSKKIKKCTKIQRIVIEYAIISEPDEASRQKNAAGVNLSGGICKHFQAARSSICVVCRGLFACNKPTYPRT